jgi:hypothetical protein
MVENNTIVGNHAELWGGGLVADLKDTVLRNCIIWGNTASGGDSQVRSPSPPSFSCIQDWTLGDSQNIAEDPRFVDPDGPDNNPETWEDNDYRLLPDSPCIDAGVNAQWMWEATDLDGNRRILFGGFSLTVDMGAYEFSGFADKKLWITREPSGNVRLTWVSQPGDEYTIWSCSDLISGTWEKLATTRADEPWTAWVDVNGGAKTRFYRIAWTE